MIIYCCADLIFATKIRSTAETLGVASRPVRNADMLAKRLDQVNDGKPNGPVTCFMLDLDTGEDGLALIGQVKGHSPSVPILAFGSHVATELLEEARRRGADDVLPRSAFTARLPQLIEQHR